MKTSWQGVSKWYNKIVGEEGHYYHQHVVIPGVIRLLKIKDGESLIDLACGNGVLRRNIKNNIEYLGIDISRNLIDEAKRMSREGKFMVADVSKELNIHEKFDFASIILALQNIKDFAGVIKNAGNLLKQNGKLIIVLNHPCFRIPRQSSWEIDKNNKLEYRRINRYMSPLEVPIGVGGNITWSFHNSISAYFKELNKNGFVIETLEEWTSDKTSIGGAKKMEDRARNEFPLFMTIVAKRC
jgi:SAM-dependent methyltransferase